MSIIMFPSPCAHHTWDLPVIMGVTRCKKCNKLINDDDAQLSFWREAA